MWVRSAGDNDSTAVKPTDDQLAARRAFRAKHPRAPRKRRGSADPRGPAPIDPSLGTGLIDNIICEPEDSGVPRDEAADDVLDRYQDTATSRRSAATPVPADRLADDELDEIELELRLRHPQPMTQATGVGLRGTADLAPDVRQMRTPRRWGAQQPVSRRERLATRPLAASTLVVAAVAACMVVVVQPGGSSHRAPSPRSPRILKATGAGSIAAVTPGQLTTAAHLRALVAINGEKTTAARATANERRKRARTAHRRAVRQTKARNAARAAAATHAAQATVTPTSTSPSSEAQPTADGGPTTARTSSTSSQGAKSPAPAGPTGGIGSMTGGCTPQC